MSPEARGGFWESYRGPTSDPRTIITPDAFEVHPDLLGVPLAQHGRRAWAMTVDLLLVAVISQLGALLLGILVAAFLLRATFRRKDAAQPSLMTTAFRGVVGCMGAFVLLVTAVVLFAAIANRSGTPEVRERAVRETPEGVRTLDMGALNVFELGELFVVGGGELRRYRRASDEAEALRAANALARHGRVLGMSEDEVREVLQEAAPTDAPWRGAVGDWELEPFRAADEAPSDAAADTGAPRTGAADLGTPADTAPALAPAPFADLPPEIADSLRALEERLEGETRARARAEESAQEARRDLVEARQTRTVVPGIRAFLRRIAEDLGVGFGWAALYFTVFTTWWNGRTPGKRFMRLRVVRLSGERLTWWDSFERYGGYAAGFATGLLGFAQVYWDPNRQAIHDRIGRTVVIQDGKPPVPGRWKASVPLPPRPSGAQPEEPRDPPRHDHA